MIISEIKKLLETASGPVARVLYLKDHFKVLAVGFKKGMILKDHKTPYETKLLVIEGSAEYHDANTDVILKCQDEYIIPVNEVHHVIALDDCICLLIQS
jgi:quercetin dioxygenase-like cupin family protein